MGCAERFDYDLGCIEIDFWWRVSNCNIEMFQSATRESDKLKILGVVIEDSKQRNSPINIRDDVAKELVVTVESPGFSDALKLTVWRAISFCGASEILREFCRGVLYSNEANYVWQEYAFRYLMKNSASSDRSSYLDLAASSSNYRLRYAAAVQDIESNTLESLRRLVDISELRDPYDHSMFEAITFWINSKGDSSLIPYIEEKLRSSTNPDVISDLSDWIEMLSA